MIYKVFIVTESLDETGHVLIRDNHEPLVESADWAEVTAFAEGLHRLGLDMAEAKAELEGSKR